MSEVPKFIQENCMECHPRSYELSTCEFVGEIDELNNEYLYQCCQCGAKSWVSSQWANEHAIL